MYPQSVRGNKMTSKQRAVFKKAKSFLENSGLENLPSFVESQIIEVDNFTCAIILSTTAGQKDTLTTIELQIPYAGDKELDFPLRITNFSNVDGSAGDFFDIDQDKIFRDWKFKFITETILKDFGFNMEDLHPLYKIFREMEAKVQQPSLDNVKVAHEP
jgi:hypothetical protein